MSGGVSVQRVYVLGVSVRGFYVGGGGSILEPSSTSCVTIATAFIFVMVRQLSPLNKNSSRQ